MIENGSASGVGYMCRVDDWRGTGVTRGVAVGRQGRCLSPRHPFRFQSSLIGRVEDWRAGVGRSLCSL